MAATKNALVEYAEQCVEDGGRALKDFIEESYLGFGKHAEGVSFDDAFFELANIDGAKEFARLGEATEEIFEIVSARCAGYTTNSFALCGAGWADDKYVLARDCG